MSVGGFELSQAILVDATRFSQVPSWMVQEFDQHVVQHLPQRWKIGVNEVERWLRSFDGDQARVPDAVA